MALVQHDDMVDAVSPDAANQAFLERILPRASRRKVLRGSEITVCISSRVKFFVDPEYYKIQLKVI
jgi:hypothetical protein